MSYALLDKLNRSNLPAEISGDDVDLIRAYLSAGLVTAVIKELESKTRTYRICTATILTVTLAGKKALDKKQVRAELLRFQTRTD